MITKKQKLVLLAVTSLIAFTIFSGSFININALENTISSTYGDDMGEKGNYPRCPRGLLKDSVNELKDSGVLDDNDVKNIDSYMLKEKEAKEAEMKEKIYNFESEKIDNMVKENSITKEKGDKLKSTVKENIEEMRTNRRGKNK